MIRINITDLEARRLNRLRETRMAATRRFRARHPIHVQKKAREHDARRYLRRKLSKFGITVDTYDEMMQVQNGLCAVCRKKESRKGATRLLVDHCHRTGRVRGLLCHRCNSAIGLAGESRSRLLALAEYMKEEV